MNGPHLMVNDKDGSCSTLKKDLFLIMKLLIGKMKVSLNTEGYVIIFDRRLMNLCVMIRTSGGV